MVNLYLGSPEESQISSLIKSSDAKASLDGYAHEALSMLLLCLLIEVKLILSRT
jgi:hypothetical protein